MLAEARKSYQRSLDLGAERDAELERVLGP
jgi:hypothetical protein